MVFGSSEVYCMSKKSNSLLSLVISSRVMEIICKPLTFKRSLVQFAWPTHCVKWTRLLGHIVEHFFQGIDQNNCVYLLY